MRRAGLLVLILLSLSSLVAAQPAPGELPPTFTAAVCTQLPVVDGSIGAEEWAQAAHYTFMMPFGTLEGKASVREVQLWLMNSKTDLCVAFSVPDSTHEVQTDPPQLDLLILCFNKGAQLQPGADRKVLYGDGTYQDKHYLAPQKDALDEVQNGQGALAYHTSPKPHYEAEFVLPLDSKDKQDVSLAPGEKVRLQLVFADGFNPDLKGTRIGGIGGADIDDASDWRELQLAKATKPAAFSPSLQWLAQLFPWTGEPDEFSHRLQRLELRSFAVGSKICGEVTCKFYYPEVDGRRAEGLVRFFLPPELKNAGTKVPLLHTAGYEVDAGWAKPWLRKGFAVTTVHAHALNPVARGPNLEYALLHIIRALPFVDDSKVALWGGSAGGYMTLMLAAQTFPLSCAVPLVPPTNLVYNFDYFKNSNALAHLPSQLTGGPALPVLASVLELLDQVKPVLGPEFESEAYYYTSPVAQLDGITAPVLAVFSTADMLVPIDQQCADWYVPFAPDMFPRGFQMRLEQLVKQPKYRQRLLDVLPGDAYQVFKVDVPKGAPAFRPDFTADAPVKLELPFSLAKQWSLDVVEEGAPLPYLGHFKYNFDVDFAPFVEAAFQQGIQPSQLTQARLELLMRRYGGHERYTFKVKPAGKPAFTARRLDYPLAEKADVLRGLATFARTDACAKVLYTRYEQLPAHLKLLGAHLGDGSPAGVQKALERLQARLGK